MRLLVRHAHDWQFGHRPDRHLPHWHLRPRPTVFSQRGALTQMCADVGWRRAAENLIDAKHADPDREYVLVVRPDELDAAAAFFAEDPTVIVMASGS